MRVNLQEKGLRDIYAFYSKNVDKPIEYKEFSEICKQHNKLFMEAVLTEGVNMRLPFRLGYLRVKKTKMDYKHMKLDYGTFNKTGEKVYHMNTHSDDFKARILWEKSKCIIPGKRLYCLQPTREYKRTLASIMKSENGHKRYLEE
jgi:hypothetical protein